MKLFELRPVVRNCQQAYDVYISWRGLVVIVAILTFWGFAVHMADRMIWG